MRYLLLLLLLTSSVFANGLEGSWLFAAKNKAIIRIFEKDRFYSVIVSKDGILFYGYGAYTASKDRIEYTYANTWPKNLEGNSQVELEELVSLRLDTLEVRLQEIGVLRFSRLTDLNAGALKLKKLTGPIVDIGNADQFAYQRMEADKNGPTYPFDLKRQGGQGFVIAEIVIDQTGKVFAGRSVATNHPLFAQAIDNVIYKWKFAPCTKDGKPVNVRFLMPCVFTITDD